MKTCIDCKKELELELFPFDKSRNRYLSVCKKCTAIRTEKYRQNNKDKWRDNTKKHSEKYKTLIENWKSCGCQKCGDKRSYVIEAHHIDPTQKDFSIGTSMRGIKITEQELKKCIPLCANCHKEFHYLERQIGMNITEYLINHK